MITAHPVLVGARWPAFSFLLLSLLLLARRVAEGVFRWLRVRSCRVDRGVDWNGDDCGDLLCVRPARLESLCA